MTHTEAHRKDRSDHWQPANPDRQIPPSTGHQSETPNRGKTNVEPYTGDPTRRRH